MNKVLFILLLYGLSFAQDFGYIQFESEKTWVIEINDTLITSNHTTRIETGIYNIKARPQISYSWPAINIESEVTVESGDTTYFRLTTDKSSVIKNINISTELPKTTSYQNLDYQPSSPAYPKIKTGLLITSIAANWLAFYLKREADRSYVKYNRASAISDINKFYDLAGDFDNASSIMLGISAAALSGYIYIALTE